MVVAASCCGDFSSVGTGRLNTIEGKDERSKVQRDPWWKPAPERSGPQTMQKWLRNKSLNVLEWPSQSPDWNPIKCLLRDLKIAVQWHSSSNLTELERICREKWEKLPKYRCCSIIPKKTQGCNHCQRCFNKVLSKGSECLWLFLCNSA